MKKNLILVVVIFLITALVFALTEGISSLILFFGQLGDDLVVAERLHTKHDPLLGWINKPNIYVKDMYGPGKHVRTNAQGFRNEKNFNLAVPAGKNRWICTGDSFTFGYGVDNESTWCSLFQKNLPQVETVNMGQGGYGLDQAYLWYMRDGVGLPHQLLIFAFTTPDLIRMTSSEFSSYPKPVLMLKDGKIIKQNVPVPEPDFLSRTLPRYEQTIRGLKTVQLFSGALKPEGNIEFTIESKEELSNLVLAIFKDLHDTGKKNGRTVLFVHLPILDDCETQLSDGLVEFFNDNSRKEGWLYINLIDDIRTLNTQEISRLFILKDIEGFSHSARHYTEQGNKYIYATMLAKMAKDPSMMKYVQTGR